MFLLDDAIGVELDAGADNVDPDLVPSGRAMMPHTLWFISSTLSLTLSMLSCWSTVAQ